MGEIIRWLAFFILCFIFALALEIDDEGKWK